MKTRNRLNRRRFIQSVCMAGAALAASTLLPASALAFGGPTRQQTKLLMGTTVTLTAAGRGAAEVEDAFALAFAEIERQIAIFDRRNNASALGVLNSQGRLADAPQDLLAVLNASKRIGLSSGHAFNPAITPLLNLISTAGPGALPGYTNGDLEEALALCAPGGIRLDGRSVRLERGGMLLTLDGIAKGYIADAAAGVLAGRGLYDYMVNAGGDIRASGRNAGGRPWNIGVQHPGEKNSLIASVSVSSGGLATSGSYENSYNARQTRHHLVSHLTGKSADTASVTVRAPSAMQADATATALALMPPAEALRLAKNLGVSALIVDGRGIVFKSADWA